MAKISKRTVDALICVGAAATFLWDEQLSGFGVKALPTGVKRYFVKYRTGGGGRAAGQRWYMLGTHGHLTPDQARALAQQALAAVARGEDPQLKKQGVRSAPTVKDVWERFEAEYLLAKKPATKRDYLAQWRDLIEPKFGRLKVEAVSRGEIDRFHKSLRQTPYRANRVLALFSRLMSLAEIWEWRSQGSNPCKQIERFNEKARTRFLSVEEIRCIGAAQAALVEEGAVTTAMAHAIELLLLTGARLNEILGAQWEWVDWKQGVINLPDSKTGAKPVYLSKAALELLHRQRLLVADSKFVFPSRNGEKAMVNVRKSWIRICERAEIEGVRLHDLRHTAASIAVGRGASLAVVGKLLGHSQAQTTMRYAHVDLDPALVAANEIGDVVKNALHHKGGV